MLGAHWESAVHRAPGVGRVVDVTMASCPVGKRDWGVGVEHWVVGKGDWAAGDGVRSSGRES